MNGHLSPCTVSHSPALLWMILLILFPLTGLPAGTVIPDGGSILRQIQPDKRATPSPSGTGLRIEREGGARLAPGIAFEVNAIRISGNTLFDTATLHALVANAEGKRLTLSQLTAFVASITDYYWNHGFPLSRAIIPAQEIRDGVVDVEIIEARYGRIGLVNHSRVNDPLLQATLSSLKTGQAVSQTDMDHALLLLSDIPGVVVDATLQPGEAVGTSDLLVNTGNGAVASGIVTLDNFGNRYTGRTQIGGTKYFINPLRHGDVLSLSGLTSGSGLIYGQLAYESLLNGQGTRAGASYAALNYSLGEGLEPLDAHGTTRVASLWVKHPLLRRRDGNLYTQMHFSRLALNDHIDASSIQTDRHLDTWTLSLAGDRRDSLMSGAVNSGYVGWTGGRVSFDDAAAQLADAVTADTQGEFSKWNASFTRQQILSLNNTLFLALSGQWANTNLDSSQKMIVGGPYTVRAYDTGAISGDTGYLGTIEFRHDLRSSYGQWQAIAFVDSAHVRINKTTWIAGLNSASLSGAGVGINWTGSNQWDIKAAIATPIGATPALVADTRSTRAWIEVAMRF
jgi:hemolysin activation/secretion protein